jgi:hypothetical protein
VSKNKFRNTSGNVGVQPQTFRLPKAGTVDPFFGGARTFWILRTLPSAYNNFKPPVKSIVVKEPGTKRGCRFIVFESAKAYFDTLLANQETESPKA